MVYLNGKTEVDYKANFIHWECSVPSAQIESATIPLRDGYLNLTPMLSEEIHYNSRSIVIGLELRSFRSEWATYWSQIMRDLHGREVKVSRSDDPNFFYVGVASVGAIEDHGSTAGVAITIEAQPFKRTSAFVEQDSISVSGTTTYTIKNPDMRGYPIWDASTSGMTVSLNGETWTLPQGESEAFGMYFSEGDNELTLTGSGTLGLKWRGGLL